MTNLATAAGLALRFLRCICGINPITRSLHRQLQVGRGGQALVVLHGGFAGGEGYIDGIDAVNAFQRFRYAAGATTASHASDVQVFSLHFESSFDWIDKCCTALQIT